jgi:predicted DNA-binding protein with PD1-like motif
MIGGHLDFAIVSATAEIFIDVYNERFARIFDPDTGLRKLDLKKD